MTWLTIETAPFDRDLELAVIEDDGEVYALVFACRRGPGGWFNAATGGSLKVYPTHWRQWTQK